MLLWLHLKLEAAVLAFEMLPSLKARKELYRCEDVLCVRKEHYRDTVASARVTVQ